MKQVCKLLLFMSLMLFASCADGHDDPDVVPAGEERWRVMAVLPVGGLGDHGYNDNTLIGLERALLACPDISMTYIVPESMEEGEWLSRLETALYTDCPANEQLMILFAGSEYRATVEGLMVGDAGLPRMERKRVLLFESAPMDVPVNTFRLISDSASAELGRLAAGYAQTAAVLLGSGSDPIIAQASEGFARGFREAGGTTVETHALSEGPEGFAMPSEAYRFTADWQAAHPEESTFIFPLAGGSNMGVYRYTREYPGAVWTAGLDVDQRHLSKSVIASLVKHTDEILLRYVLDWREGRDWPRHTDYDLDSGMIELIYSETTIKR